MSRNVRAVLYQVRGLPLTMEVNLGDVDITSRMWELKVRLSQESKNANFAPAGAHTLRMCFRVVHAMNAPMVDTYFPVSGDRTVEQVAEEMAEVNSWSR